MPIHWTSKVSKRYERNAINGNLNRSYQIGMNSDHEKERIRGKKYLAGFPTRFVDNVNHQFRQNLIDKQAEYKLIIRNFLFAEPKKFILVKFTLCISNENTLNRFLGKLQSFVYHKLVLQLNDPLRKSEVCFVWKIKIRTLLVKFMKILVPVQQITSVKQKDMMK